MLPLASTRTQGWSDVTLPLRNVMYAPSGDALAFVCSDGATWFYDIARDRWAYALDHASESMAPAFSPDGALFASADRRGAITVRDVAATLAAAPARP